MIAMSQNFVMPSNYCDMHGQDLEYDGGVSKWGWFFIGCAIALTAGLVIDIIGLNCGACGAQAAMRAFCGVAYVVESQSIAAAVSGGIIYGAKQI